MKTMKQQGFTLIELVIVIIILGILAVTAAPKFLNLSNDARTSTVSGLEGALRGGINIVYSRAAIDGVEAEADDTIQIGGGDVTTAFGYPAEAALTTVAERNRWIDLPTANWTITGTAPVVITPAGFTEPNSAAADTDKCRVEYTESAANGATPVITAFTGGC
ncbi:prepilin-type N-terminal cleavage/methylation domain-containing protein [Agarivorans sp. QJM3NY_29]|uniref:prepilin-type N-terminal cleavage/methylation domain-containing protein n=1 Tax=unclassified Agarivorans TaxID=2636026 RepID=UPI003D7D6A50